MRFAGSLWRVLLVALAIGVSACGTNDGGAERLTRSDYQAAILDIVEDSARANALYTELVAERLAQQECTDGVRALHDEIRKLIDRVASLRPPREVTRIQDRFLVAANESLERVRRVGDRVAAGKVSCGQELNDLIYGLRSSDRADRAIRDLEDQGYHVFGE